jgi:hypothetical protein
MCWCCGAAVYRRHNNFAQTLRKPHSMQQLHRCAQTYRTKHSKNKYFKHVCSLAGCRLAPFAQHNPITDRRLLAFTVAQQGHLPDPLPITQRHEVYMQHRCMEVQHMHGDAWKCSRCMEVQHMHGDAAHAAVRHVPRTIQQVMAAN